MTDADAPGAAASAAGWAVGVSCVLLPVACGASAPACWPRGLRLVPAAPDCLPDDLVAPGLVAFGLAASEAPALGAVAFGLAAWGLGALGLVAFGLTAFGLATSDLVAPGLAAFGLVAAGLAAPGLAALGLTVLTLAASGRDAFALAAAAWVPLGLAALGFAAPDLSGPDARVARDVVAADSSCAWTFPAVALRLGVVAEPTALDADARSALAETALPASPEAWALAPVFAAEALPVLSAAIFLARLAGSFGPLAAALGIAEAGLAR